VEDVVLRAQEDTVLRAQEDTVLRAQEGFEEFVAAALPGLLRFGVVLTGDRHRADDLVQTALVKTMRRWRAIDHDQPVAYVRRAMVNAQLSGWRRGRRETALPEGFDVACRTDATASYDDQDQLARALAVLPPRQRAVIVLRYYAGFSEAEIAETLGCATGTVKSQASKALQRLRAELGPTELAEAMS
jgi:RNA polymerase sigma-70 factor (sigma-E family)